MADDSSFGAILKAARIRAGFATQHAFADALADLGLSYSDEAIGHWENDRRSPYSQSDDRAKALAIFDLLAKRGGITTTTEINHMLRLLDRLPLTADEIEVQFAALHTPPKWAIPNPPQYFELVGRETLLDRLIDLLMRSPVPVISVAGLGGIGKTALIHAAIRAVEPNGRFERFAWETAQQEQLTGGVIRPIGSRDISLRRILHSFVGQLQPGRQFSPLNDPLPELRRIAQSAPCLLVLDNLETVEAAHEAVAALAQIVHGTQSRALVSSREKMTASDVVAEIALPGLSEPMTARFVQIEAYHRQIEMLSRAEDQVYRDIHVVTGGMPLALKLVIGQFAADMPLDVVLERVKNVVDERELYSFIYLRSWRKLSLEAKKVLIMAAGYAVPTLRQLLFDAVGIPQADFDRACVELSTLSLLETAQALYASQQRYGLHPMTRWFVNSPLREMIEAGATDL